MASALGEAQLLDVTTSPRPRASVYPAGFGGLWGAGLRGPGVPGGLGAPLRPAGQTPPASSPSPMATGILTTPCWSSPASAGSAASCPLPGPPWWGSTLTAPSALGRPDAEDLLQDSGLRPGGPGRTCKAGWEELAASRGTIPYKEGGKGGSLAPSSTQDTCAHCGLCRPGSAPWGPLGRTAPPSTGSGASPASGA